MSSAAKDIAGVAADAVQAVKPNGQTKAVLLVMFLMFFGVEAYQTYKVADFGERLIRVEERQANGHETLMRLSRQIEDLRKK